MKKEIKLLENRLNLELGDTVYLVNDFESNTLEAGRYLKVSMIVKDIFGLSYEAGSKVVYMGYLNGQKMINYHASCLYISREAYQLALLKN